MHKVSQTGQILCIIARCQGSDYDSCPLLECGTIKFVYELQAFGIELWLLY
jgi:hypothetical protein